MGVHHSFENKIKPQLCFFLKKTSSFIYFLFFYPIFCFAYSDSWTCNTKNSMATESIATDDEEELKKKIKLEEEKEQIRKVQDELEQPITDPIRQSTVDYYNQNKDKVSYIIIFLTLTNVSVIMQILTLSKYIFHYKFKNVNTYFNDTYYIGRVGKWPISNCMFHKIAHFMCNWYIKTAN